MLQSACVMSSEIPCALDVTLPAQVSSQNLNTIAHITINKDVSDNGKNYTKHFVLAVITCFSRFKVFNAPQTPQLIEEVKPINCFMASETGPGKQVYINIETITREGI